MTTPFFGYNPWSIAVGDFKGDHRLDMAIADSGSQPFGQDPGSVRVLWGNGDGTFRDGGSYYAGPNPDFVAVGDFNGDGIPDLAVTDSAIWSGSPGVSVLLGKGDGTFGEAVEYATGTWPNNVAVGDFNGDRIPDLVVADGNGVSLLLGNGDGTFQKPRNIDHGGGGFVAVGDFNGDGNIDLVAMTGSASRDHGAVSVWLGNGDGTFGPPQVSPLLGRFPSALAVVDLNGDGKPDLAVADSDIHAVEVLLANGDGSFGPPVAYDVDLQPRSVVVGDFNGDGKPDLAANPLSAGVTVLLNRGDGTFPTPSRYPLGGSPSVIARGDFNGDGIPDLAVITHDLAKSTVSVLLGKGDGTFGPAVEYQAGQFPYGVAVAVASATGERSPWATARCPWPWEMSTATAPSTSWSPNHREFRPSSITVFLGNGDGTFQPGPKYEFGDETLSSITLADLTGTGKLDLIVARRPGVAVLLGNGDGTFQPPVNYWFDGPASFAVGDFDRDGIPDLAVANYSGIVSLLLGNGDGSFRAGPRYIAGATSLVVAAGDFQRRRLSRPGRRHLASGLRQHRRAD